MHRRLIELVENALNRTTQQKMSSHLCAPCFYRLEKEEKLNFAFLACMDGNNSLKSIDTSYRYGNPREDDRMLQSLRWLETEEVNMFQDEVANAAKAVRTQSRKMVPLTTRYRSKAIKILKLHGST
jgi:hypothetical protein